MSLPSDPPGPSTRSLARPIPETPIQERTAGAGHDGLYERDKIILRGVTKRFPTLAWPALDHVDLVIERGSFFTVIGPSGAGKSTLLRVLAGLVEPETGEVSVFGEAPVEASRS